MKYKNVRAAIFRNRPNRFLANVEIDGKQETVHVKNTGRCRELLIEGAEVYVSRASNPARKTAYDLIAVRKSNGVLFNIDSQAPNKVVYEWLKQQAFDRIIPEYTYGDSRIDFYMERNGNGRLLQYLLEVKGCTLEMDGVGYFPDAPTERGVKHLYELRKAAGKGYQAAAAFVIQMDGVTTVQANRTMHPQFGTALDEAVSAGVKVLHLPCHVEPDRLEIIENPGMEEFLTGRKDRGECYGGTGH